MAKDPNATDTPEPVQDDPLLGVVGAAASQAPLFGYPETGPREGIFDLPDPTLPDPLLDIVEPGSAEVVLGKVGPAPNLFVPPPVTPQSPARALGAALAEAAAVLEAPRPMPRTAASRSWDRYVLPLVACHLTFMTILWLWPERSRGVQEPAPIGSPNVVTDMDLWDQARSAAREKRHTDAITLLERHLHADGLSSDERLLVYQQLAIQCRLAGQIEESMKYAGLAQAQTTRIFTPQDLLRLAETAYTEGRNAQARRLFARLLLLESSFPADMKDRAPFAALRLADSYQAEADRAESKK